MAVATHAAHTPRDDLAELTPKQTSILARVAAASEGARAHRMLAYDLLRTHHWDEEAVEDRLERLVPLLDRPLTNAVVTRFYGCEADGRTPRACTALLEDGRGGVARDREGNPLTVVFGVPPALDAASLIDACVWSMRRVARFAGDAEVRQTTTVVDLLVRGDADADKAVPIPDGALLDFYDLLPEMRTKTYVCGAHRGFRAFVTAMGRVPVLKRYVQNFVLCDDYASLSECIARDNRLPHWDGGTFDFDLSRYRAALEAEEG